MRCAIHPEAEAIGTCRACSKGVCRACAGPTGPHVACSPEWGTYAAKKLESHRKQAALQLVTAFCMGFIAVNYASDSERWVYVALAASSLVFSVLDFRHAARWREVEEG